MNPYNGEVTVNIGEKTVTLRFPWRARGVLRQAFGEEWLSRVIKAIQTQDCTDLAVIIETGTNGAVTFEEILESEFNVFELCAAATKAFKFSLHGINEAIVEGEYRQNPTKTQKTRLSLPFKWPWSQA